MSVSPAADERINWISSAPFLALHLLPLAMIWTGVPARMLVLAAVLYFVRIFFITAGYHRYFAHRAYRLPRWAQLVMATGGTMALQKGPLWWAGHHRHHHQQSDTDQDIHSPIRGFWWSHMSWIMCDKYSATDEARSKDFAKYPELRWLNRHDWVAPLALAVLCFSIGGWAGLVVGFGLSTVLVWHGTFLVNSLAHIVGRRRFATSDTSRNSFLIALVTNGEGWHNNHHHYQASARQGFRWYEWDPTYYALWILSKIGIVRGLKQPTQEILTSNLLRAGHFDLGMFRTRWNAAAARLTALGVQAADALADRRHAIEAHLEATRHDLDAHLRAQRDAFNELALIRRAARLSRPLIHPA